MNGPWRVLEGSGRFSKKSDWKNEEFGLGQEGAETRAKIEERINVGERVFLDRERNEERERKGRNDC